MATRLVTSCVLLCLMCGVLADFYDPANYDGNYDEYAFDNIEDSYFNYDDDLYDDFAYGADDRDPEYSGYGDYDMHYYGDEYDEYYQTYGLYGDEYGGDYFFDYEERLVGDCTQDASGKAVLTESVCDIKISGVDKMADKLPGGIDGTYKVSGCWNNLPLYKRQKSPADQERTLWFSKMFSDWDISMGPDVDEGNILMYGGDGAEESRPNFVPANHWYIASEFTSAAPGSEQLEDYVLMDVNVACTNGKELEAPEDSGVYQPLLTQDEMEAKYRDIYVQHGRSDSDPSVNFTMVVFVVLIGVSVVLGIPYMMFKPKGTSAKSLAQVLEESRKKRAGHTL